MGLALLVLGDLCARAVDIDAFYTDPGVLPRSLLQIPRLRFSFHALGGGRLFEEMLLILAGVVALLLLWGVRARPASAVSWLLLASIDARNPLVLNHGDELLKILLFWSVFVPLSAGGRASPEAKGRLHLSVFTAALVLQVCAVYFFGALLKSDPSWWSTGTAVATALSLEQFSTGIGRSLLDHPTLLRYATLGVFYLELAGPLLVFLPWANRRIREGAILLFVAVHVGIALTLKLGLFPWVSILGWVLLLPSETLDVIQRAVGMTAGGGGPAAEAARQGHPALRSAGAVLGAYLLGATLLWNIRGLGRAEPVFAPTILDAPLLLAQLDQRWNMFAPKPNYISGWYAAQADLADGTHVDLMRDGQPFSWRQPDVIAASYPDFRWRRYLITIWRPQFERYRPGLLPYLEGRWDGSHPGSQRVQHLMVTFVWRDQSIGADHSVQTTVIARD